MCANGGYMKVNIQFKDTLDNVNNGRWLQLEGSHGRHIAHNFLDTKVFIPTKFSTIQKDGYGRVRHMPIFKVNRKRIEELNEEGEWEFLFFLKHGYYPEYDSEGEIINE